ncbi:type I restriction-modification system endonuclease [Methanimicrococcus blatticola]|uniref:Type I restriction enzyme R subunit n=1 Tax=Methanimicrococcus blatticola TaxID=91560 RepID=A0A484F7U7_9EURY|nr:type I restriction-modification system endonuclease [Methanimicrococcus blatticola]MBZ3934928.1 type I restriction-modification system endonuclease [Methanimicrococcus blatticola]MCC2508973.1 type I restriction-modification system endonuclease [Methanimicrococcus blatticola]TDQ70996.1 type I restriction enzyme R subunit [Methanimicrococcus blatticola]
MKSNFSFLEKDWPELAKIGQLAERNLYDDTNTALLKMGIFSEKLVQYILAMEHIREPEGYENTAANRISILKRSGLLPREISDILHVLRQKRNDAAHDNYESETAAQAMLQFTYQISVWFYQTYKTFAFKPDPFFLPENEQVSIEELKKQTELAEQRTQYLEQELEKLQSIKLPTNIEERIKISTESAQLIHKTEKQTRILIDEQLRDAGWEADSEELTYAKGVRPQSNKNIAIAEWPTDSSVSKSGYADYALFIGLQLVGIIEAKKESKDVSSDLDYQCKEYAQNIKKEHEEYVCWQSDKYRVPFLFATNGRPYLKQLSTKSGIWFLDVRRESNAPKALPNWFSPLNIKEMLETNISEANEKMKTEDERYLTDPNGLNLRPYQVEAVEASEKAIIEGKQSILLSMATGTGKTRTVLGIMYKMLKNKRFKRILFLVDRNPLGEQAMDTFQEVRLEEFTTLDSIYNINPLGLKSGMIEPEVKVQISTVQSLVQRILIADEPTVFPGDFDLIIVDEAHRGYILDKEMDEDELVFKNHKDYISKYRTVLEYFDAVKIALTATPALHTTEIFGSPVFNYGYRQAVIEGYLIPYDPPINVNTELNTQGIHYKKGEILPKIDAVTGELLNSDELEDDVDFEVEKFNKDVITESFNRTVLYNIADEYLDFSSDEKTLIFATNDAHADLIVQILKEYCSERNFSHESVMKITGATGGGDSKKTLKAIKRFKNEKYPNVAVTVDLLTTGIDVPSICNLVFLRRVRSRVLYEQMLGRATRRCDEIGKTSFKIFDAVGIYDALNSVSTMKPISSNPHATIEQLIQELDGIHDERVLRNQIQEIAAKLQRSKRTISDENLEKFRIKTDGLMPDDIIKGLLQPDVSKSYQFIQENYDFLILLEKSKETKQRYIAVSDKPDSFLSFTHGYGKNQKQPQDYLEEFKEFIDIHKDKIPALMIVCTQPASLKRDDLKKLQLILEENQFSEHELNAAWKEMTNADITADIISFIRKEALGIELVDHNDRIQRAFQELKQKHTFNKRQENLLNKIEKHLLHESVLDAQTFDEAPTFKSSGGFKMADSVFGGQLNQIIFDLNSLMYGMKGL